MLSASGSSVTRNGTHIRVSLSSDNNNDASTQSVHGKFDPLLIPNYQRAEKVYNVLK